MTETPFRVTLDLHIGAPPAGPADFHVQAEVFKQEWESFRDLPQPWRSSLPQIVFFFCRSRTGFSLSGFDFRGDRKGRQA
jgi:hypothetical protein